MTETELKKRLGKIPKAILIHALLTLFRRMSQGDTSLALSVLEQEAKTRKKETLTPKTAL